MNLLTLLNGKRTKVIIVLIFVTLFGSWQGWWKVDPEIYAALFGAAIWFLRSGIPTAGVSQTIPIHRVPPVVALAAAIVLLGTGCARFKTLQTDVSAYDPKTGQQTRTITTEATSSTFFDSDSQLANFKATQTDKTQSASVGSLNQSSSGSNTVAVLESIARIVNATK